MRVEALELGYKAGFHSGMAKGYEYGFHEGILGDKNKGIIIGSKVDADVKQVLKDKGFF